jgi:hydroxymethylglutaryl-CoA synthase
MRLSEGKMVGITSYGVYIPLWRLSGESIAKGLVGEKAIANFDEDALTMAVAASLDCLNDIDRESVDRLLFASTNFPYREKQAASIAAAACDLRRDIVTADFANCLRGGTTAILSAVDAVAAKKAKQVMVAASDCRLGTPGSDLEQIFGDGAAALLIGDTDVAVSLEASYSVSDDIMDVWRTQDDTFVQAWESRFVASAGYQRVTTEAINGLLGKCNMSPKDFSKAIFCGPDQRRAVELARNLGFDVRAQLQDSLINVMGNTGTPYPLMLLVAALEECKPGAFILLSSYGDGADAFVFRVTEQIEKLRNKKGMKRYLASKRKISDYRTFLLWRGLLDPESKKVYFVPYGTTSIPAIWRERNRILRLHGSKCKICGAIQFPPQRVCTKCHAKDQFEEVRLSNKKGTVFTFAIDKSMISQADRPVVSCVVDFDGGGRADLLMTDRDPEEVKVGMRVEMTFRQLFFRERIYHYYWKAMPIRL